MAKLNDPRTDRRTDESPENEHGPESGTVRESSDRGVREQTREVLARNPYSSVLTGFGLGLGFGLAVTLLLTRREETWYERHVPDSVQDWPNRLKRVPETVASQVSQAWNRW